MARRPLALALSRVVPVLAVLLLAGCLVPILGDDDRQCVAFHDCNMCSSSPCVAAFGCTDGRCEPIDLPDGTACEENGEGLCYAGACLVAAYPTPSISERPDAAEQLPRVGGSAPIPKHEPLSEEP